MSNKTVIITGGTRGIGAAVSQAFYEAGYAVVISSRTDSGLAARLGERARFIPCDVRRPRSLEELAAAALRWSGRIDVLVNNAGMSAWRPLERIDEAFWQDMIDTNLKSVLFSCRAVLSHLTQGGSIVNVSSLAGKRGSANNSVYCAAKFGVNGITQSLAKELGPRGIRVNAVCPVYVTTDGLDEALKEEYSPAAGRDIPEFLAQFAATQTALGVLPSAAQVAATCVFLASPAAAAITGQCINVDCGVNPQ